MLQWLSAVLPVAPPVLPENFKDSTIPELLLYHERSIPLRQTGMYDINALDERTIKNGRWRLTSRLKF